MDFQVECLKAHNECRRKHGVAPLKLSKEMCRFSQNWANTLARRGTLEHSNSKEYGENIFCVSSTNPNISVNGEDPVKSWYEEIEFHQFGVEPKTLSSGHFTQVVWKESKELGVALAKSKGKVIVVANYSPAGNVIGQFATNVCPVGGFEAHNNNIDIAGIAALSVSSTSLNRTKTPTEGTEGNFEEDFLNAHNDYRKRHGVNPLTLDKKLCKYSEEWAKILASKNNLEHRKNSPYGENIFCMYSSDSNFTITGHNPVDRWYEEIKHHPFGREPNSLKSGHFTQVVWKTSELLGVGVAKSRQGSIYVVANYSPAGNFVGNFADNVPPLWDSSEQENGRDTPGSEIDEVDVVNMAKDDFEAFALDALKIHNEYRRKHGVPKMKLSKELCEMASEWAEKCAKTGNMAHRPNNSYGENIFCMYSSDFSHSPSARDAVKKWYEEMKDHSFGTETVNYNSLHFSQVIWKESVELGIAMAKNKKGQSYVVANYNPRGNIVGNFIINVPKPKV